jgi:hypothetical protein
MMMTTRKQITLRGLPLPVLVGSEPEPLVVNKLLETFDAFIGELVKRKRRWTRAERELYEAVVRSLAKSAIRQAGRAS